MFAFVEWGPDEYLLLITGVLSASVFAAGQIMALWLQFRNALKTDRLVVVSEANHAMLNGTHIATLRNTAELSRWKAQQTGNAGDRAVADLAEQDYQRALREAEENAMRVIPPKPAR